MQVVQARRAVASICELQIGSLQSLAVYEEQRKLWTRGMTWGEAWRSADDISLAYLFWRVLIVLLMAHCKNLVADDCYS